jgi:hypothetical protein
MQDDKDQVLQLQSEFSVEVNLSKKILPSVEKKWEQVLTEEKINDFQTELALLKNQYNKELTDKNETIKLLLTNFDKAEDHRRNVESSHFQLMSDLVKAYEGDSFELEKKFMTEVETRKKKSHDEQEELRSNYELKKKKLTETSLDINRERKRLADDSIRDRQEAMEEIRNKNTEDTNNLRFSVDTKIEDLDEQFELIKNDYLQQTEFQSESLDQQISKDKAMTHEMIELQTELEILSNNLNSLQAAGNRKAMQNSNLVEQLIQRKNDVLKKHRFTKEKMESLLQTHHERLKALSKRSNERKMDLEKQLDLAQRVIKLIHFSKKTEDSLGIQVDPPSESHSKKTCVNSLIDRYNSLLLAVEHVCHEEDDLLTEKLTLTKKLNACQKEGFVRRNGRPDCNYISASCCERQDALAIKDT